MSTLDVACERCDKRFRVRAEFAGKTTRCPGCSAPITIGGSRPAPPPREERVERPAPRPKPRDDDERPRGPTGDWRPVDSALGREQVAVTFALATVPCSFCAFCLGRMAGTSAGVDGPVMVLSLLLILGPTLVAGAFGITARVVALGAPPESQTRGTAIASLLCAIAGVLSVLVFGLAFLATIDRHEGTGFMPVVATIGLLLSAFAAVGTFVGLVAQVGIVRRSSLVSSALGRMAMTACVAVLVVTGLSLLLALAVESTTNSYSRSPMDEERVAVALFGVLLPLGFAAILVGYHRLLAAARRAVREEPGGRFEG